MGFLVYYRDGMTQRTKFFGDLPSAMERSTENRGQYVTEQGNWSPEEIRDRNNPLSVQKQNASPQKPNNMRLQ